MDRQEHDRIQELIQGDYLDKSLVPLKCTECNSENFTENAKSIDAGVVSESELICAECGQVLGYWAYGYWQV